MVLNRKLIMMEQWIRWKPIEGLAKKYYIESITDSIEGFKIILSCVTDPTRKVHVIFDDSVDSYKRTDESFKLSDIYEIHKQYGNSFCTEWTFFKVVHSTYAQWVSEQSFGTIEPEYFMHFSLIAMDSVVDIICDYEPTIVLIKDN